PNLSEFACHLLSIPSNSTTSEWVWSLLGNIHKELRNLIITITVSIPMVEANVPARVID
ncbi:46326_t:CDS:2, partial [Gigaspora margarita]